MAIMILFLSTLSLYYFNTYYAPYDAHVYKLKLDGREIDLNHPRERWDLPKELEEISGLSFYRNNKLACVQDEDGIFYIYDLKKKEISRKHQFGEKGDYEGVEVVHDTAYVLKSNGDIFQFKVTKKDIGDVFKLKTDLTKKNDSEGLGFHKDFEELLIACKEEPGTDKVEIEKSRSVYRITLNDKRFKKKPKFVIDGKSYNRMLDEKGLSKKKHKPFKPSGVAVDPKTNYTYVIGTVGKMMVILNDSGEIEDLIPMNPKVFWQPEGICFSPDGDLYISSEGIDKKGYILKF
ncbi:MAG: SdiA-regulated domain-containing protein [Cytophagales bacterium]|nr:SdiA-regulated domain-containing protein [Cytophagales bacterium]